jgi:8-oxo-dGTP pyrophosphatase MutT (NUDIX family)
MKAWKTIGSTKLIEDRWLTLRADKCLLPNGAAIEPYYVVEERAWIHVMAVDALGRILTVRQYRYAADVVCTELPGGVVDAGEAPLEAAVRELREETGFSASRWELVGEVFANPARQTNKIHIFLAEDLHAEGEQCLDESEEIMWQFESESEIRARIKTQDFSQSLHIASFYMALERLQSRP